MNRTTRLLLRLSIGLWLLLLSSALGLTTIQVCQNKDCCRRFRGKSTLVEILQDLLTNATTTTSSMESSLQDSIDIQATGCLSQCDLGPNLQLNDDKVVNGLVTPLHAVALLQDCVQFAPKLINAVTSMEKAQQASTLPDKERYLCSVIQSLDQDPAFRYSSARIHAQTLRAQARLDEQQYDDSLRDVHELTVTLGIHTASLHRIQADCYEALQQYPEAAVAWQYIAKCDTKFQTKATKEIQRLQDLLVASKHRNVT